MVANQILFDTPIGACRVDWDHRAIQAVRLQSGPLRVKREEACPPHVRRTMDGIRALLRGEADDLQDIPLAMAQLPAFHQRVYAHLRTIVPGTTSSYGEVACALGAPGAARAVGQALQRNPFLVVVPCHRVLTASGHLGGFSAPGGLVTKLRLLGSEQSDGAGASPLFSGRRDLPYDSRRAVAHLRRSSAQMARLIAAVGPLRLSLTRTPSLFASLAEAIVSQQLSSRVAVTVFSRLCALFPRPHEGLDAAVVARASVSRLRSAGLSQAKARALRELAHAAARSELPSLAQAARMNAESLVQRLTALRGIGRWTVEMVLLFQLGHPDILPVGDLAIRKGLARAYDLAYLPAPSDVAAYGEAWRPFRSAASWYLWQASG
jgi:O-6-methylguanine DNA methyltransferase